MCGEPFDGRKVLAKAKQDWWDETHGEILFEQWLDCDTDPQEPGEEEEQ